MLIEHPHDFCRVHSGAAAQRDDNVGLEFTHSLRAVLSGKQRGIGLNVGEHSVGDVHLVKLIGDRLGIAVFIQE